MIITESEMYWLTRLDALNNIFGAVAIIGVIVGLMTLYLVMFLGGDQEWYERNTKRALELLCLGLLLILIGCTGQCFVPTAKEMAAIKLIPAVSKNENVQELPNKVVDLANEWLDELRPKSDKENQCQ
ncbi:MAG TPA: hypothetical protein HPP87_07210 [Planctomycetes bacterium]|nr:hypothetical protein [Planctomycetota bacterium]